MREYGSEYDFSLEERPLGRAGGSWGPALIHVHVHDADMKGVRLRLTSGEARTLARQLVAMAGRLDLEE